MVAHEPIPELRDAGVIAFTTTREAGSFNAQSAEPMADAMARWNGLINDLGQWSGRFATARQVHGARVLVHEGAWQGWLRSFDADGHFAPARGTAMAVTVADCVPVFVAHPGGACAVLHAGWRGTAAGILEQGLAAFRAAGHEARDLIVHLGPSICGRCYEVGPEVHAAVTGRAVEAPTCIDLRAALADRAAAAGVRELSISRWCTRCHNERFFSHRCGDAGRQLGVIVAA